MKYPLNQILKIYKFLYLKQSIRFEGRKRFQNKYKNFSFVCMIVNRITLLFLYISLYSIIIIYKMTNLYLFHTYFFVIFFFNFISFIYIFWGKFRNVYSLFDFVFFRKMLPYLKKFFKCLEIIKKNRQTRETSAIMF